jgi:hypothetical protein
LGGDTTFVLLDSGTAVIINGKTQAVQSTTVPAPTITTPVIVIGSSTYTANSASQFVVGGQTLTQGGVITAAGETVSLAHGGSSLVIMSGSVTETESIGGVTGTSTVTSQAKSTHTSGAGLEKFVDVWVIGGCLSAGLLGVLEL